ncbi:DUF4179 domain-containing protein [Halobacillus sp. BAB-2008]|uniref:DUF4179 domain-containing protein n=1 Tax=Halobacillus sp. BAB-2008 TaxID=1246484 RepID=UPI0002A4D138|nr:DUF4179 domain-containing protein [Halobacillus sp. BAB-2008]ELK48528.1 hypothetical protein D479_02892 [Halobacillus sp. BAB-2008]
MKEKLFNEKYNDINVPEDDVRQAIKMGVRIGSTHRSGEGRKGYLNIKWFLSATAFIIIMFATFAVPSVSHVMAQVPVVGHLYSTFNDSIGRNLASQNLVTELEETATAKDIKVRITSAYYDGAVMGVTVEVKGDVQSDDGARVSGFYEIYQGDESVSDSREIVYFTPIEDGYTGQIQIPYPYESMPEHTTFPLEFLRIGKQEGEWSFDVPVKQLPYNVLSVNKESEDTAASIRVQVDSIIEGKASTAINYTASFPSSEVHNQVRLEAYDDRGREITISMDGIDLETKKENGRLVVKGRSIIPEEIRERTSYIEIYPKVALTGKDPNDPLELDPIKMDINSLN